jgi:hypothetical protein
MTPRELVRHSAAMVMYLSRDAARLRLRIELRLAGAGALRFSLQSATDAQRSALARSES